MEKPSRKQNRLPDYDYSQNGAYCTQDRKKILSKISVGTPREGCPYIYGGQDNKQHSTERGVLFAKRDKWDVFL